MGVCEEKLYAPSEDLRAEVLARKILRDPSTKKLFQDCYRWKGQRYWIIGGRVLTRTEADRVEEERRLEKRLG